MRQLQKAHKGVYGAFYPYRSFNRRRNRKSAQGNKTMRQSMKHAL